MVVHVGFIAPGYGPPTEHGCTAGRGSGLYSASAVIGPPIGVEVGDPMVACVGAGATSTGPAVLTPDPAWTAVYTNPTSTISPGLFTKIADQDDADGVASYSWVVDGPELVGLTVIHLSWPRKFGATLSDPVASASLTPSVSSPGGRWQLVFIYQRTNSTFAGDAPEPAVTSTAELLCESVQSGTGGARAGNMRVYASDDVSPITGAYATSVSSPYQALVAAAVNR